MTTESAQREWDHRSMADVTVPEWAKARSYQLWDYTPSHRTLLARSPASGPDGDNVDIRFTGVRSIHLAAKFEVARVDRFDEESIGALKLFKFLIVGPSGHGTVIAEDLTFDRNSLALFEGLPDAASGTFEDSKTLELTVRSELICRFPEATVSHDPTQGPDFEVSIGDRRAFVEVIRSNEDPASRQIRRLVMERIPRWNSAEVRNAPLVIVVGGVRPDLLVEELPAHLVTALGQNDVDAIVWDESGPSTLARKLEPILRFRAPGPTSVFQVFEDASGRFRWRLKASNGEILASSEAYATAEGARQAIAAVSRAANAAVGQP